MYLVLPTCYDSVRLDPGTQVLCTCISDRSVFPFKSFRGALCVFLVLSRDFIDDLYFSGLDFHESSHAGMLYSLVYARLLVLWCLVPCLWVSAFHYSHVDSISSELCQFRIFYFESVEPCQLWIFGFESFEP